MISFKTHFTFSLSLLLATTVTVLAQNQQYKSFKLIQRELLWQQVYDSAVTVKDALSYLEQLPGLHNGQSSDAYILFDVNDLRVDYLKFGTTTANTSSMVSDYAVSGKLKIERKDNKYRVTLYGIQLFPVVYGSSQTMRADFSYHMLNGKRDTIRPSCASDDVLGLYHKFFLDYFRVKRVKKDDW